MKDGLIKEKQAEIEDLQSAIRQLEKELERVKESPIIKEVEVFKMPEQQQSEPDDNRDEEMKQQLQDYANQVE